MRGPTLTAVALGAIALTALAAPAAGQSAAPRETAHAAAAAPLLSMNVDTRRVRRRVKLPKDFVGFSTEVPWAARLAGTPSQGINPVADGLYANIRAAGSGGPSLRIGGSSGEESWWNPTHAPRPPGIKFDIDQAYFQYVRAFAKRNTSQLVMTLNLANGDPSTATEYARNALATIGPGVIRGFELGNEPDIYKGLNSYKDAQGRQVKIRPQGYAFTDYLREWRARADVVRGRLGPVPLVGPSFCCEPTWLNRLPAFLAQERDRLSRSSLHEYVGAACSNIKPGTPSYPTKQRLLGPGDMDRIMTGFRTAVRQSARVGKKVELVETNTFACGGQPGVSDTFTSSLWGAEYLWRTAGTGIVAANLHTFGRAYSPFDFSFAAGRGWTGTARPLYYGALLFARATAGRATLLLDPVAKAKARPGSNAVAFPALKGNRLRVMVLSKSARRGGRVSITVPRGARVAGLTRLSARGLGSKAVTLGGQKVAAVSRTGRLQGRFRASGVRRRDGAYSFRMPPAGGALLEVRVRR